MLVIVNFNFKISIFLSCSKEQNLKIKLNTNWYRSQMEPKYLDLANTAWSEQTEFINKLSKQRQTPSFFKYKFQDSTLRNGWVIAVGTKYHIEGISYL